MSTKGPVGNWYEDAKSVKGFLLDIFGVLIDGGEEEDVAIQGSVEAVKKLKENAIPVRFCTNTSSHTRSQIAERVRKLGFPIEADEIFPPPPAVVRYLKEHDLRPFLIVDQGIVSEFSDIDQSNPNCVVLGDAQHEFSYQNINKAFEILSNLENPVLISMGAGRYYKMTTGMKLDVGTFAKALEHACDIEAKIIGKPAKPFFMAPLEDMNIFPEHAVMIGDDIVSDIGGAQACGVKGVQVRTGQFRPHFEPHPEVKPDGYVDNLLQAVDLYLQHR